MRREKRQQKREQALLSFLVGGTLFSTGLLTKPESVLASPAPVFSSVLNSIKSQLPKGLVMRLPAFLPDEGVEIYPTFSSDDNSLTILLWTSPNCNDKRCDKGSMGVSRLPNSYNGEIPPDCSPITLKPKVRGYYCDEHAGSAGWIHQVDWEQDGMLFYIISAHMSRQEVIDVAKSMANESPIESSR